MRFLASIILPMRTGNVSQWLCKTCLIIRQTCSESADGLSGLGVSYVNQGEFNASGTHETRGAQIKITKKMHDCFWALLKKASVNYIIFQHCLASSTENADLIVLWFRLELLSRS